MKTLIHAAVVTLCAASTTQAQQAVQWRVEDGGNGHWYRVTTTNFANWSAAQIAAEAGGAHLAAISTEGEWNFIRPRAVGCYLGGYQDPTHPDWSEPAGGWRWITGEAWAVGPWAGFGPDDAPCHINNGDGQQDVLWLAFQSGGIMDDIEANPVSYCPYSLEKPALFEWSADCNNDGIVDYGQILDGTFADVNADGIPDVCQAPCVPADLNNDRSVDGADLGVLLSAWGPAGPEPTRADINGNGIVDGADLGVLLANWGACGEAPPWATVVQWQPDPAVVTDDQLRSAIAATGLPWRVRDTSTQIEMLLVPPGTFQMGCIMGSDLYGCGGYELPVHDVTLTNAFYLARYELTQADWVSRMGSNPSQFQSANPAVPVEQVPSRPVEGVTWSAAQAFLFGTGLRLPTEAEWELACRAGTVTPFFNGSTDDSTLHKLAWYWDNACQGGTVCGTRPVGGRLANALGFHDMLGNVYEWVSDWFGPYGLERQTNPTGPSFGTYRVLRGASWVDDPDVVRSSDRYYSDQVNGRVGFRVARNP
jgi:formylglycine-generating enzyme required for sulfatase activity